ncbi:hypothetical protein LB561_07225 [Mesorhizobium sp. B292B1B]|uniref:hypothetical protein n=1 Tax=unclassified Mesorhizobium TaxID=325217 RepID=UPI00112854D5|nr:MULTISPECIES: hypothetical protein [unclassified Mesorhizobium]MCA0011346.1 hypothetical protein [Mesorhizobium sp. B294B1A1]MCA0037082.1 hypothetical protein [Mesorhizobium sp. B292B1B]TPM37659.1 hypothetical protein FJ964_29625 [Mesorhizobium sp. B2-3-2]
MLSTALQQRRSILTIADMNRLEQAARISMGEFQDPGLSAASPAAHGILRIVAPLVAIIVLIALSQLP